MDKIQKIYWQQWRYDRELQAIQIHPYPITMVILVYIQIAVLNNCEKGNDEFSIIDNFLGKDMQRLSMPS